MKKGLKLFATGFVAMSALALHVNAEEVTDAKSLTDCVAKTENTCTLKNNIEVSSAVEVGTDIVLDLNGYTLSANKSSFADDSLLVVLRKGALTVQDSSATKKGKVDGVNDNLATTIKLTKKGENDATDSATLVVNSGTIVGKKLAISGNGYRHNTEITINGGEITSTDSTAIYQPQSGTLNVTGGTITGTTGIEIRSGNLNVTGGTIRGTYKPVDVKPNGSGTTTKGAGIAIAQHTTEQAINVKINNGTIEGHTALYESNPQENAEPAIEKISLEITGGTFNAINEGTNAIYSENLTKFISKGTFNTDVSAYMVESKSENPTDTFEVITLDGEVKYVVAEEAKVEEGYFGLGFTEEGFKEVFEKEEGFEEVDKLIKEALGDKYKAAIYYELVYGDLINDNFVLGTEITDKLDNKVKVTLDIPETIEKLKEGYTRKYSVIRIHENDDKTFESSVLPATEKDGKVTFETDRFSTYVLAYEDVKDTKNPNTGDNMLTYFAVAIISVVGLMLTTLKITKKSK